MNDQLVHDLAWLTVGDLTLAVSPPTDRTTLEVIVDRDASLVVKAPRNTDVGQVKVFIDAKRSWIYRRLAEKDALAGPPVSKEFVDGEGFSYLGRSYRLKLVDTDCVKLERGRLLMSPEMVSDGSAAMRAWYASVGTPWLRRRIRPWTARLGFDAVAVDVRDLGYRWGSCRMYPGPERINIHWATLQLPPTLIDYVLVHELAHLQEPNHTPTFWGAVGRVIPHVAELKAQLSASGRALWLGASAPSA